MLLLWVLLLSRGVIRRRRSRSRRRSRGRKRSTQSSAQRGRYARTANAEGSKIAAADRGCWPGPRGPGGCGDGGWVVVVQLLLWLQRHGGPRVERGAQRHPCLAIARKPSKPAPSAVSATASASAKECVEIGQGVGENGLRTGSGC